MPNTTNPIERIVPGDYRLPPGLLLPEACDAEILPDGRVVPQGLPPAVILRYFPDLVPATPSPAKLTITTPVVSAPKPAEVPPAPAVEEL
jgi:hypothetical protein